MNKIIKIEPVKTTEDCKEKLNSLIGQKNWKRLYKLGNIRCFTNEDNEVVTIAEGTNAIFDEDEYDETEIDWCLFVGVNIQDDIKAIRNVAKMYYTCDYGNLFYNPYTKTIHIVVGDGGYCYSEGKLRRDKNDEIDWNFYRYNFKEFNSHTETAFIQKVVWADEYSPEESGFILVGSIKLIDEE